VLGTQIKGIDHLRILAGLEQVQSTTRFIRFLPREKLGRNSRPVQLFSWRPYQNFQGGKKKMTWDLKVHIRYKYSHRQHVICQLCSAAFFNVDKMKKNCQIGGIGL
jgi:hypothetical protein